MVHFNQLKECMKTLSYNLDDCAQLVYDDSDVVGQSLSGIRFKSYKYKKGKNIL